MNQQERQALLRVAREAIAAGLDGRAPSIDLSQFSEALRAPGAAFVTLEKGGALRGCIGTLEPRRPLVEDVAFNAYAAANRDPRFSPLSVSEFPAIELHVSVLGAPEPIACKSEEELLRQLRPGIDGLVLQDGMRRATFLPSVWEHLADPRDFVRHLKQKAGLPADYWSSAIKCYRYGTESFGEGIADSVA